ncbi:MAG: hypothetical protein JST55_00140 [Bacteroidetes bacterium]|nr:hypothetical protein [Bacteroidota bacterium]
MLKSILFALVFCLAAAFFTASKADAWPKHRHHHIKRVYLRTYVAPATVWVPGHWAYNKFGIAVWRKGHWKRVYR